MKHKYADLNPNKIPLGDLVAVIRKENNIPEDYETNYLLHARYGNKIVFTGLSGGPRMTYFHDTGEVSWD